MEARRVGSLRWYGVLLVRVAALVMTGVVLQTAGSAAWNDHVLGMRGEPDRGTVVAVRHTSPGRADRVEVDTARFGGTAWVTTPRKDLDVGDTVDVVVDPRDPARAELAGDGWPWRQIVIPLTGLLLIAVFAGKYGRWRDPEPPAATDELVRGGAT
ncbi:DUF3592 domain-containing protein [Pseudonocardia sp. NPDC049154]|uniref:DUF3592 domain-containing protein n=1 Tax=Pseudonocardia sp. NPDC049154 TaxID=3155501 RepID=UPI003402933A